MRARAALTKMCSSSIRVTCFELEPWFILLPSLKFLILTKFTTVVRLFKKLETRIKHQYFYLGLRSALTSQKLTPGRLVYAQTRSSFIFKQHQLPPDAREAMEYLIANSLVGLAVWV